LASYQGVQGNRARAFAGLVVFAAAWLPAQAASAANSPTFRDCAHLAGIDPDFVQLTGATVGPGGTLTLPSSQSSVTVEASESSLPGDNLNQVSFSVTVTGTAISPKTISGMGTGHVTLTVPLSGVAVGGQYSLDWFATFDNGSHACPGGAAEDPQNPSSNPFVLHVVAGGPPPAPVITKLGESHKTWREHAGRGHVPVGTTFGFDVSETAQVKLRFSQMQHGHVVSRGTLSVAGVAGHNSVHFNGKLPGGQKSLAPGRYVAMITATNAAGESSATKSLEFKIVG
jgi:hypothetical protein